MGVNARRLRVLFIDDEELPLFDNLRAQGYDVDKHDDVDNLDQISDGRYQVIFFDVRGIGRKIDARDGKSTGLDILKFVARNNPLIFRVVYSAKPFDSHEVEDTRKSANRIVSKDTSAYDIIELLEEHARRINKDWVLEELSKTVKLGWWHKLKIKSGWTLTESDIKGIARKSGMAADAVKIAANCTTIAVKLIAIGSA